MAVPKRVGSKGLVVSLLGKLYVLEKRSVRDSITYVLVSMPTRKKAVISFGGSGGRMVLLEFAPSP